MGYQRCVYWVSILAFSIGYLCIEDLVCASRTFTKTSPGSVWRFTNGRHTNYSWTTRATHTPQTPYFFASVLNWIYIPVFFLITLFGVVVCGYRRYKLRQHFMRERTSAVQSQRFSATNGVSIPPPPSERGTVQLPMSAYPRQPQAHIYQGSGHVTCPPAYTPNVTSAPVNTEAPPAYEEAIKQPVNSTIPQ